MRIYKWDLKYLKYDIYNVIMSPHFQKGFRNYGFDVLQFECCIYHSIFDPHRIALAAPISRYWSIYIIVHFDITHSQYYHVAEMHEYNTQSNRNWSNIIN